jgi:hypothetical protein
MIFLRAPKTFVLRVKSAVNELQVRRTNGSPIRVHNELTYVQDLEIVDSF